MENPFHLDKKNRNVRQVMDQSNKQDIGLSKVDGEDMYGTDRAIIFATNIFGDNEPGSDFILLVK